MLLTPAFPSDEESFGWNYLPQLGPLGIPHCSVTIPDGGFGDLQHAAEYVVLAVRRMSDESGRKVILFGVDSVESEPALRAYARAQLIVKPW